ncbi:Cardioacceleratory peptide receptor, partial [Frankliniella fusca]
HRQCWIELPQRWQWRLYITLVFLALFALPALIISTCYTVIVCTIWNKSRGMAGPRRRTRKGGAAGGAQRALTAGPLLKRVKSVPSRWGCAAPAPDAPAAPAAPAAAPGAGGSLASVPVVRATSKGSRRAPASLVSSFRTRPLSTACSTPDSFHHGPLKDESDCRRASSRGIIPRAKIKTVKMTLVIVFVFVLCWSPYFVLNLLQVYDRIPRTQTNIAVASFVQSLAPLNSAANPLIYCLFSTHICRTLRGWVSHGRDGVVCCGADPGPVTLSLCSQEGAALHVGAGAPGLAHRSPGQQLGRDGDDDTLGDLAVPPRRPAPTPRHHPDSRAARPQCRNIRSLVRVLSHYPRD